MHRSTLRVLLLEGSDDDAAAVRRLLTAPAAVKAFDVARVRRMGDALAALAGDPPDVVLLGTPSDAAWLDFFVRLPDEEPLPPIVVLTDAPDRTAEAVALQAGAAECVGRTGLSPILLERALLYAVQCRRTAEELEETESRFRSLSESITDGALIVDEANRIVYANPSAERLFGWDPGALTGEPLWSIIPPALREGHRRGMERYLATGVRRMPWSGVAVAGLRRDGAEFPIEISFGEYARKGNRFFTAVIRDVTARRAAEDALRASEDRLRTYNRALVEISRHRARVGHGGQLQNITRAAAEALHVDTVGVWLLDAGGARLVCADQYDHQARTHTSGMACGPRESPAFFEAMAPALASTEAAEKDHPLSDLMHCCTAADENHALLATPIWLNGRTAGVVCSATARVDREWNVEDRTFAASLADHVALALEAADRRAAEAAVRASEGRLAQILNAVPAGVVVTDAAGAWLYENAAAARILRGEPPAGETDAGRGPPVALFLAGTDEPYPDARTPLVRALAGELASTDDVEVRHPSGPVPLHIQAAPLRAADGEVSGAVATFIDISERVRLEERLRLAARMEAVGGLAGGIAHEFNNLLTAIRGNVDLLLMDAAPGAPEREDLEEIRLAADRAETLTRQLLAFGRQQILRPRVLRLADVVLGLQQTLAGVVGPVIEVVIRAEAGAGAVMADPGQIEQVLLHLAVNARDAMPDGGTLSVEVRNAELGAEDREKYPYVGAGGEFVQMVVTDTGPGMDLAVQSRIFEPFFTTKGPGNGTGLGLSTVYGIVKQSGGYVWVDSAAGEGCRFRVYLPRVREPDSGERPGGSAAPAAGGGETVLLVEDEPGVRRVAARALRAEGYAVLEADGVEAGVRLLEQHGGSIHLLVTDLVMPGGGGRRVADAVRAAPSAPRVLYMSGHTAEAVLRPQVDFDRADFLQKPFTPRELCQKVREVLARGGG